LVGLGVIAGIAALFPNGAVLMLGFVPLAFFVGAFAAARSHRGALVDITRAAGVGLLGLVVASVVLAVAHLLAPGLPAAAAPRVSPRDLEAIWVAGGFVLGCWLVLGIILRVLR
jgi:hypothetical protein